MKLIEIKGDLFSADENDCLAHCVSQDLHMGKGIAVTFKNKYGNVNVLKLQNPTIGKFVLLPKPNSNGFIYYLVTKSKYYGKPLLEDLTKSLISMKAHMVENKVRNLAMPRIGCGLDGLKWTNVKDVIIEVFSDMEILIKIYKL